FPSALGVGRSFNALGERLFLLPSSLVRSSMLLSQQSASSRRNCRSCPRSLTEPVSGVPCRLSCFFSIQRLQAPSRAPPDIGDGFPRSVVLGGEGREGGGSGQP